ncbi:MAG: CocE/NonD family hydrolase, partial [Proteobacteria bacterium]|nr:CocE/NonD family hydrolase [Pseudomonadota bacterium]
EKKKMINRRLLAVTFALVFAGLVSGCSRMNAYYFHLPPAQFGVKVEKDVMVPMRDGVNLATDVYLPKAPGSFPVLFTRLPYGKRFAGLLPMIGRIFAERGYVFVIQDVRGRFKSEGRFFPFVDDAQDGIDNFRWIQKQPWSNGRIGSWGLSYLGYIQWVIAPSLPELKVMSPAITTPNMHEAIFRGGVMNLLTIYTFFGFTGIKETSFLNPLNHFDALKTLPVEKIDDALGEDNYYFNEVATPERSRHLLEKIDFKDSYSRVQTPALMVSGWYDMFLGPQINDFQRLRKEGKGAARQSRLIIGPWAHVLLGGDGTDDIKVKENVFEFPETFAWYDHWLKGVDNGAEKLPAIRYFLMGANEWKTAEDWPPAGFAPAEYYLHSQGQANTVSGNGGLSRDPAGSENTDSFEYDPLNPVPTRGGSTLLIPFFTTHCRASWLYGPANQLPLESRKDVLVYTTPPLIEPLEVSGYEYTIDLWQTANLFRAGHRIRVEISSSNFPRYVRNLNTGGDLALETNPVTAHQQIYHDAEHPSRLIIWAKPAAALAPAPAPVP